MAREGPRRAGIAASLDTFVNIVQSHSVSLIHKACNARAPNTDQGAVRDAMWEGLESEGLGSEGLGVP